MCKGVKVKLIVDELAVFEVVVVEPVVRGVVGVEVVVEEVLEKDGVEVVV